MSSAVIGRTMTKTTVTRAAAGLAMLVLVAGACTVNIDVDPSAGLDPGGETNDALDEALETALDPDLSGPDPLAAAEDAVDGILDAALQLEDAGSDGDRAAPPGTGAPPEPPLIVTMPPPAGAANPVETAPTPAEAAEPPATGSPDEAAIGADPGTAPPSAPSGTTPPSTSPTAMTPADDPGTPPPAGDLLGEPYEYGPAEGDSLAVVGVDHDDILNVRDVPFGEIIATLGLANPIAYLLEVREAPSGEPIAWYDTWTGTIVATGRTRKLPTTIWHEVQVAGLTGWASGAYLAPIGFTDDITAHLIDRLGERPVAGTLTDLALIVGEAFASEEPPSRVVVTVGPSIFEALGEVTVDVLNLGDDSLLGYRLHIFATPSGDWMSDDPGPFTLRTVGRAILCYSARGVTAEGLCI